MFPRTEANNQFLARSDFARSESGSFGSVIFSAGTDFSRIGDFESVDRTLFQSVQKILPSPRKASLDLHTTTHRRQRPTRREHGIVDHLGPVPSDAARPTGHHNRMPHILRRLSEPHIIPPRLLSARNATLATTTPPSETTLRHKLQIR